MSYDAKQIANWFLTRAQRDGENPSIMTLLKLSYIAHGWRLEMKKTPLFGNKIEAWQYGPVIPDVYNSFRSQGVRVSTPVNFKGSPITADDSTFLENVYEIYGNMSAFKLSDLTHEEGGPWHLASQLGGSYAEIPNHLIQSHYEMKRLKANNTNHEQ